jgi:hypothetical protein
MRRSLALAAAMSSACGGSYTLDEEEGVDVARAAFMAHSIYATSTRPLGPLTIDEVELTFTIDGWSLADKLGFEYVSDGDPDVSAAVTELGSIAEQPRLQAAIDEALMAEPGVHILVIRTWGHETYELAREQLTRHVDEWLTARGR